MSEQDNGCAAEELSETERRLKHLENEVHMFTRAGVVEIAVRNPSVMEYMKHWEGRAVKAEMRVKILTTALENARKDAPVVTVSQLKEWRDCIEDLGSGKGGWAWEDVIDEISTVIDALTPPTEKAT